jgi:hypothetical protein
MSEVIMEIREVLVEQRAELRHLRSDVKELKEDKKRVIWGVLAVVGSVAAGVVMWALNSGAKPLMLASLLLLSGCFSSNRQEQVATTRTTERVGIEQGQPTQLTETVVEKTTAVEQTQAGVDVAKAVTAAMAGFRLDLGTGGLAGAAGTLGLLALREFMARRKAQQDAEDEWKRANESHAREVELAKQLPPKA